MKFYKKRKSLILIASISALLILTVLCRDNNSGQGGPLLLQVHFTQKLTSVSKQEVYTILQGKIPPRLRRLNISRICVDDSIKNSFKSNYPECKTECTAVPGAPPAASRDTIFISGSAGLVPSMKLLAVDNIYPWGRKRADHGIEGRASYPLRLSGAEAWHQEYHHVVVQTGVTAMTRAFMRTVERHGDLLRPVKQVRHITASAHLATTSNEVSFTSPCTWPLKNRMLFCSPKKYFNILTEAGFDLIELTGNHNNDYGRGPNLETISLIEKSGMKYFGGGKNRRDAYAIRPVKVGDTTFVFLGFNQWGPPSAWATEEAPGAARLTKKHFIRGIKKAVASGDVVFVTVQWGNENNPVPHRTQVEYFHLAADLGAHIMVSSSAHRAMGLEFYRGKFISYGLGNFLFDQMQTINHRRGLIARHHFYNGRHVQTELIPYLIYRHSEPRLISGHSADSLFRYVYRYSRGRVFQK